MESLETRGGGCWIEERAAVLQKVLERRTAKSALLLPRLFGRIRLEPFQGDIGKPYFRAVTSIQSLALLDESPEPGGSEPGSNSLHWWTRRESDPAGPRTLTG
jgi:hypothetical protein